MRASLLEGDPRVLGPAIRSETLPAGDERSLVKVRAGDIGSSAH
jgi:hypothetical protein